MCDDNDDDSKAVHSALRNAAYVTSVSQFVPSASIHLLSFYNMLQAIQKSWSSWESFSAHFILLGCLALYPFLEFM